MRALLLAAGLGTRLRPVTDTIPKCLVRVHGVPLLDYWLALLLADGGTGIERVLINTHYRAEQVRTHVRASRWRDRVDLVHEPALLGTGGTILANAGYFAGEACLVAHADNLTRFAPADFLSGHRARPPGCLMTMMTFETDTPHLCGIVSLDAGGVVQAFAEKDPRARGTRANAAVYVVEPAVIGLIAAHGRRVVDLSTEVLPALVPGRIFAWHNAEYHRDIGTPSNLAAAEREYVAATAIPCLM